MCVIIIVSNYSKTLYVTYLHLDFCFTMVNVCECLYIYKIIRNDTHTKLTFDLTVTYSYNTKKNFNSIYCTCAKKNKHTNDHMQIYFKSFYFMYYIASTSYTQKWTKIQNNISRGNYRRKQKPTKIIHIILYDIYVFIV